MPAMEFLYSNAAHCTNLGIPPFLDAIIIRPQLANGDIWNEPLNLKSAAARCAVNMRGNVDGIFINSSFVAVNGWVVDPTMAGGGLPPVAIRLTIDGNPDLIYSNPPLFSRNLVLDY